jgi:hypothetical protein
LEKKIKTKDEVLAELMAEHVRVKKRDWGTLTGVWVPHDTRGRIVDFVRRWQQEIHAERDRKLEAARKQRQIRRQKQAA